MNININTNTGTPINMTELGPIGPINPLDAARSAHVQALVDLYSGTRSKPVTFLPGVQRPDIRRVRPFTTEQGEK